MTCDHFKLPETFGSEEPRRFAQLLEESKKERFQRSGGEGRLGALREESHLYLGFGKRYDLRVCPLLVDLGGKLGAQANIDKVRRKAREERKLNKPEKPGPKKKGKPGDKSADDP